MFNVLKRKFNGTSQAGVRCPDARTMVARTSARPDFHVCPFHSRDLDEILAIERESFTSPWTRAMFEAELQGNPFGRFFGAFDNGDVRPVKRLLGYICYWVVFDELRLMNLAVRPDCRRRGIASHLVRHAVEEGMSQGAARALLEVRASNHLAQKLYGTFGFRQYGRRRSYYTNPDEDAMLMELQLGKHVQP